MSYENKAITSVSAKLESALKDLEAMEKEEFSETIDSICAKIRETIANLSALKSGEIQE